MSRLVAYGPSICLSVCLSPCARIAVRCSDAVLWRHASGASRRFVHKGTWWTCGKHGKHLCGEHLVVGKCIVVSCVPIWVRASVPYGPGLSYPYGSGLSCVAMWGRNSARIAVRCSGEGRRTTRRERPAAFRARKAGWVRTDSWLCLMSDGVASTNCPAPELPDLRCVRPPDPGRTRIPDVPTPGAQGGV